MVYSVTSIRTFQHAQKLLTHIQKMKSARIPVVLVGNKADMADSREVSTADGTAFASQAGISFFETSAKTNLNVAESVHQLVRLVATQRESVSPSVGGGGRSGEKRGCVML